MNSPLFPYIFFHQTVEHKNKETWDKRKQIVNIYHNIINITTYNFLTSFVANNYLMTTIFTLQSVEDGEEVQEDNSAWPKGKESHQPSQT